MSILSATYSICKSIISLPVRNDIKTLIDTLNISAPGDLNSTDRSEFGYVARNRNLEFLGYLITHIQSDDIKKIMPVTNFNALKENEVNLLEKVHNFILHVNRKCTDSLHELFPNSRKALDNYQHFRYNFVNSSIEKLEELEQEVRMLATQFNNHPNIVFIKDNLKRFPKLTQIPQDQLYMTMLSYSRYFLKEDSKYLSTEAKQILDLMHGNKEQADFLKIIFSLFCIRLSLKNLNKFLYLSFFKDKLPLLNEDNVFNLLSCHKNIFGNFLNLECQPTGSEIHVIPGEPILVKLNLKNLQINSPYFVSSSSLTLMSEFGEKQAFRLREIDENLNIIHSFYFK